MGVDTVSVSKFQKCLAVNGGMLFGGCGDGLGYYFHMHGCNGAGTT